MNRCLLTVAAVLTLSAAVPASAQFAKPEDAVKYRKAAFTVLGAHFGRVAAMANGRVPFDAQAVVANAEIANQVAALPFAGFGDGTDKGDTRAKPEIWAQRDKFDAAARKMRDELTKLNGVAKTGDQAAIRTAAGAVGQSCKGCHDNYRRD